jgi:hypothetical protein
MTSKAKQKGNSWELAICKFMGEHLGGNWMRVPNSGAYVGGKNVTRKVQLDNGQIRMVKGDIIAPENMPKMNLEAKNYKDIAFHQIIDGNCKQLNDWIEQTETPAEPGDLSLTIFKITRKGSWVAFRESLRDQFALSSYVHYQKTADTAYIVTDYESFVLANKEKLIELGAKGTV